MKLLFFVIFVAGIGNAVLRPEMENPFTLYRLIAPIGLIAISVMRPSLVLKGMALFAVFAVYNFGLATLYSDDYTQLVPSLVHYLYLFVLLLLMIYMKLQYENFDRSYVRFVLGFYIFLIVNLAVEFITGSYYPNLYEDTTEENSVRAFFWNQNDLAVVLCVIGWMALTLDRFKGAPRLAAAIITLAVLYYNDSKAAMLSFILFSIPIYFIFRFCSRRRIAPPIWYITIAAAAFATASFLFFLSDVDIRFANDIYTFDELLFRPIVNIVTLQSSGEEFGSINNRTDAAIFVTIEYLRSFGLGLGAGGSFLVLTLPQYELGGARSPHNALLQFIVDFGYPVLFGYIFLTIWALQRLFRHRLGEYERLKVMAILSFPMLGLSQSGAIITNFFFWGSVYFIAMLGYGRSVMHESVMRGTGGVEQFSYRSGSTAQPSCRRG